MQFYFAHKESSFYVACWFLFMVFSSYKWFAKKRHMINVWYHYLITLESKLGIENNIIQTIPNPSVFHTWGNGSLPVSSEGLFWLCSLSKQPHWNGFPSTAPSASSTPTPALLKLLPHVSLQDVPLAVICVPLSSKTQVGKIKPAQLCGSLTKHQWSQRSEWNLILSRTVIFDWKHAGLWILM